MLYNKLVKPMALPDVVKAYFLLHAANMSEENQTLGRSTWGVLWLYTHEGHYNQDIWWSGGSEENRNVDHLPIKEHF